jgi:hypothetical protein
MIFAAVAIFVPFLLLLWLIITLDSGVKQLRRIADQLERTQGPSK